jgi:spore germination cell wall hydrolase CwlJ-like protein
MKKQNPNEAFKHLEDFEVLALLIYGEARNQGLDGMAAVGQVVMNRVAKPRWWGRDIRSVCLKSAKVKNNRYYQFSCFNPSDPNRNALELIALDMEGARKRSRTLNSAHWIALGIIGGKLINGAGNATHYHTRTISPRWKDKLKKVAEIGDHIFYVEA